MNSRLGGNALLLRTQLSGKLIMKLPKHSAVLSIFTYNFSNKNLQLIDYDKMRKKPTFIHSRLYYMMQHPWAKLQHCHQILNDHHIVSRKAIYSIAGNKSRTVSSSTVITTTKETADKNTDMSVHEVYHDKDKKYFFIRLQEHTTNHPEVLAKLEYRWIRPGLVDLYHTEVPPEFQGKGIAKVLAKTALDTFCEQGIMMRPTCTYLRKYIRDNQIPCYLHLVYYV